MDEPSFPTFEVEICKETGEQIDSLMLSTEWLAAICYSTVGPRNTEDFTFATYRLVAS